VTLRYLLDTGIVSEPVAKEPNRKVVKRLDQDGIHCALAAPVWHELVYGCSRLPAGKRRGALEEYLRAVIRASFPILPYDEAAAAWHGKERARLEELGQVAPYVDGQIAAVARTQNLVLVTSNVKHFAPFEGLTVVNWKI
jgi:tRNA(fMet)-specific endonuclease VapC